MTSVLGMPSAVKPLRITARIWISATWRSKSRVEGEWLEEKHKKRAKRKSWRKLHLGLDLVSGDIICSDLTSEDVGDPTALPGLLDQINSPVGLFLADGAYDGEPSYALLAARFGPTIAVTIPPPKNAAQSTNAAQTLTARDHHITKIASHGRMAWQKTSGYDRRSRGETLPLMHASHTLPGNAWIAGRLLSGRS